MNLEILLLRMAFAYGMKQNLIIMKMCLSLIVFNCDAGPESKKRLSDSTITI